MNMIPSEGHIQTTDNQTLFTRSWVSEGQRAAIILVHGYAEHSGRYQWTAEQLLQRGLNVYSYDLRGHGKSSDRRGGIYPMGQHIDDLDSFIKRVQQLEADRPIYLIGHSIGGLITCFYSIHKRPPIEGLILASGFFRPTSRLIRYLSPLVGLLAAVVPNMALGRLNSRYISRESEVIEAYEQDDLVFHGYMNARDLFELLAYQKKVLSSANELGLPILMLHGTEDRIADIEGSKQIYDVCQQDKQARIYDGLFHELLNEPERQKVIEDILSWINRKT